VLDTSPKPANLRRSRVIPLVVLLVLLLGAAAALVVRRAGSRSDVACPLDRHLVPSCGALIGVEPPGASMADVADSDASFGRPIDLVYSFHDINDAVPSAFDREVVASGRVLHLDIDSRDYASADPATVTWSSVAAGDHDAELTRMAQGVASLHVPVFVTFDHEPDQPARAAVGTPADYVAAWRHVHDLFLAQGATNAVWVWVVMALPQTYAATPAFWPGDGYVDWLSWDSYDLAGCNTAAGFDPARFQSFRSTGLGYLQWLRAEGSATGIDLHLPMMISETGTVDLPGRTDRWYDEVPDVLRDEPGIKAVTIWDHTSGFPGCDFRLDPSPALRSSVARAAADPWFASHVLVRTP